MPRECTSDLLGFSRVEGRQVVAGFDGGVVTSEAGALLLGATDRAIRLVERFAACFSDGRRQASVEHTVAAMVGQRVFAMALGYEDLIDHDDLRDDPVMRVLSGRLSGPLAGKSTLNRLEHAPLGAPDRYHKIAHEGAAIEDLFVDLFVDAHARPPKKITLDLDATDDPLHGRQEGRFFHGYYDCYCYLPLYIFCGDHLLAAKLRRSNIDASAGSVEAVERIVARIRARWPRVRILLRGDSGLVLRTPFGHARETLMAWCEANRVDYLFGLARNTRLETAIEAELWWAEEEARTTGQAARRFKDFQWSTLGSWSRRRRVVAKAEWTPWFAGGKANPRLMLRIRFAHIVTSLKRKEIEAQPLYEDIYCQRGDMENRIKECQADLLGTPRFAHADRTSAATMRANQLRLWFASMAYVLLDSLRRIGLKHTRLARATCGSIRLKLLKIGALVRTSVRRVKVAMASGHPYQSEFALAHARLSAAAA